VVKRDLNLDLKAKGALDLKAKGALDLKAKGAEAKALRKEAGANLDLSPRAASLRRAASLLKEERALDLARKNLARDLPAKRLNLLLPPLPYIQ